MSLLSLCTAACSTAPVSPPAAIVGASDETATLLYALANQAGQSLARRISGGWVAMIREFEFTTAAVGPLPGTVANTGPGGNAVITVSGTGNLTRVQPNTWMAFGTGIPRNAIVEAVTTTTATLNKPINGAEGGGFAFGYGAFGVDPFGGETFAGGAGTFSFGQTDYALPADFQRPVDDTFWDRSRYWAMRGPQSPQSWQMFRSSVIGRASVQRRFRFRNANAYYGGSGGPGRQILSIDPVPLDNHSWLVFEYVSNGWCQSAAGAIQSQWLADDDTGVLDEYLLQLGVQWRLFRRLGIGYSEELDDYEREVDKAVAADGGAPILSITARGGSFLLGNQNIPESGFGSGGGGRDFAGADFSSSDFG